MDGIRLGLVETHFANIVWDSAPLTSGELVKHCEVELGWKKSTTYTVLKKFCERGIFQNVEGIVSICVPKDEFYAMQTEKYVDETFQGSLPAFIAAFTSRKTLSEEEIAEIRMMIDAQKES